ncbi:MerR family DNA-binding protein [Paraburkholderia xenovorans]|uniref:MerR family DNA-binding protein n=1 Tax=Paraburkholderia xenovorans TaxID=36873 RepID=UPI0038B8F6B9
MLTRLCFIKRSQSLGFSLDDVEALLSLHDGQTCNSARPIAEHKLADVRQRIQDLSMLEAALAKLVQRCSTSKGKVSCPLISALMTAANALTTVDTICRIGPFSLFAVTEALCAAAYRLRLRSRVLAPGG